MDDPDSRPITAALAELSDAALATLADTTYKVPQIAPGFLAWLEHAADWERDRRAGLAYPLQPPEAAIPSEEDAVSMAAAMVLRSMFAQSVPDVAALFEAIVGMLGGGERRH